MSLLKVNDKVIIIEIALERGYTDISEHIGIPVTISKVNVWDSGDVYYKIEEADYWVAQKYIKPYGFKGIFNDIKRKEKKLEKLRER